MDYSSLSQEQIDQFKQFGYLILRDILSNQESDQMRSSCQKIIQNNQGRYLHHQSYSSVYPYVNPHYDQPHLFDNFLATLPEKKCLPQIASELLAQPTVPWASLMAYSPKESFLGQPWHQDVDPTELPFAAVNCLFYPLGSRTENGCILIEPGTHQGASRLPPGGGQDETPNQQPLSLEPPDLLLLDCGVFHRVPLNHTCQERIALNFRYKVVNTPDHLYYRSTYRHGIFNFSSNVWDLVYGA